VRNVFTAKLRINSTIWNFTVVLSFSLQLLTLAIFRFDDDLDLINDRKVNTDIGVEKG